MKDKTLLPGPEDRPKRAHKQTAASKLGSLETSGAGGTEAKALNPSLAQIEELINQGHALRAFSGLENFLDSAERGVAAEVADHAVFAGALRLGIQAGILSDRAERTNKLLRRSLDGWLQGEGWMKFRKRVGGHFSKLLQLQLRLGNEEGALETYGKSHRFVSLDPATRWQLLESVIRAERTEACFAHLYIDLLRPSGDPDRLTPPDGAILDDEQTNRALQLLRNSLRIDLDTPDDSELDQRYELNQSLWEVRAEPWCFAHMAIALLRMRRFQEAYETRLKLPDTDEADADTLTWLGIVSYRCRQWADASDLFAKACGHDSEHSELAATYRILADASLLLSGNAPPESRDQLRDRLNQIPSSFEHEPGLLGDAFWVRGSARFLGEDDTAAISDFNAAPKEQLAWRYLVFQIAALRRGDRSDEAQQVLEELQEAGSHHSNACRLISAQDALENIRFITAQGESDAVQLNRDDPDVTDLEAAKKCVRVDVALRQFHQPSKLDAPDFKDARISGVARAWWSRLHAWRNIQRGDLDKASELLDLPIHRLDRDLAHLRLASQLRALRGENLLQSATELANLAARPDALGIDKMLWGFSLSAAGRMEEAKQVLDPLADQFADCLELRLARAQLELDSGNPPKAWEILEPDGSTTTLTDLPYWTSAPLAVLYRPWHNLIPHDVCGKSNRVSLRRVADMLHGSALLIRGKKIDVGLQILELAKQAMADQAHVIGSQLGQTYRIAAVEELGLGNLERACELHATASQHDKGDPSFAEKLAEAIEGKPDTPPDVVYQVFIEWLTQQQVAAEIDKSKVGLALIRCLHIDSEIPSGPLELQRRKKWSLQASSTHSLWDWPKQNLARAAYRESDHPRVLELLDSVEVLRADDLILMGSAAWNLERYELSHQGFSRAIEAGVDNPDVRSWRGRARAAVRFVQLRDQQQWIDPSELTELLPDLDWQQCSPEIANDVWIWRLALLAGAKQGRDVIGLIDKNQPADSSRRQFRSLKGLGLLMAEQYAPALECLEEDPEDVVSRSLAVSVRLQSVSNQMREAARETLVDLRRRNTQSGVYHLAAAHWALAREDTELAAKHYSEAKKSPSLSILYAPLTPLIGEQDQYVQSRLQLWRGELTEAELGFADLESKVLWPDSMTYWKLICSIHEDKIAEAKRGFEALVQQSSKFADAIAQLALLRIRTGEHPAAQPLVQQVLDQQPDHAFARVAEAELLELAGDAAAAHKVYQSVTGSEHRPRLRTRALLAMARIDLNRDQFVECEESLRAACEIRPGWSLPQRRLALFLTIHGTEQQTSEARTILNNQLAATPNDLQLVLGRIWIAHRSEDNERLASSLRDLIRVTDFKALTAQLQLLLILWSANVNLRLKRFAPAVEAFEALVGMGQKEDARLPLIRLRLAWEILNSAELSQEKLTTVKDLAERVLSADPNNGTALLASGLSRVVFGTSLDEEDRRAIARVQSHDYRSTETKLLASVILNLAGHEETPTPVAAGLDNLDPEIRGAVELIVANLAKDAAAISKASEQWLASEANGIPIALEDVIHVAALQRCAQKRTADAEKILESLHERCKGISQTRLLHSKLLAKKAVQSLRKKDLMKAKHYLGMAVSHLGAFGPGEARRETAEDAVPEAALVQSE